MTDYSKLSDFMINKLVAEQIFGHGNLQDRAINKKDGWLCWDEEKQHIVDFAPTHDPADAWPIIVENRISITFGSGAGSAVRAIDKDIYQHVASKSKMLRAAMIVFLMMCEPYE